MLTPNTTLDCQWILFDAINYCCNYKVQRTQFIVVGKICVITVKLKSSQLIMFAHLCKNLTNVNSFTYRANINASEKKIY